MPAHAVPIDIKEQGVTWLLPPYSWSIRHIARKLDLSPSVIARWRLELVQQGLLPENEKISSVDRNEWTPERRFSVVIETATLSEMELADYCRIMGLFVEQVKEWRAISLFRKSAQQIQYIKNTKGSQWKSGGFCRFCVSYKYECNAL